MLWPLASATIRCALRRAGGPLGRNPAVALLAVVLATALPVGAVFAGRRLAAGFADLVAHGAFVTSLELMLGPVGLVAGLGVALAAPRAGAAGDQVAAAPTSRMVLAAGTTVLPLLLAAAGLGLPALLFAVSLAGAAGLVGSAAFAACALLGALAGASLRLPVGRALAVVGAAAACWAVAGPALGATPVAGPAAALRPALEGRVLAPLVLVLGVAVVAAAGWTGVVALARPRAGGHRPPRGARPLRGPVAVVVARAHWRELGRTSELRAPALAAAVAACGLAAGVRIATGVAGEALLVFALGLVLVVAVVGPAAAHGVAREARPLLRANPARRQVVGLGVAAAGTGRALALVAAVALPLSLVARTDAAGYAELEAGVAFALGAACCSGALVPWSRRRPLQQLAAYGALAVALALLWFGAAALVEPAASLGLAGPAFSLVVGNAVLAAGLAVGAFAWS